MARRATSTPLFGLAPDEVYRAASVAGSAVSSYLTFSPLPRRKLRRGGMFSVALSVGSPPLGVTQHPALRSSDFPHSLTSAITIRCSGAIAQATPPDKMLMDVVKFSVHFTDFSF